jgi:hypothetical protein
MTTIPTPAPAAPEVRADSGKPTIDALHRDIALANQYRLELIKYLLAIAAALFAFTITFRPSLSHVDLACAMWLGWTGLGISMIGGMFHMLGWDHYYKSYRDYDWKHKGSEEGKRAGKAARASINNWRRLAMVMQFGGFVLGVIAIGLFAGANIDNVRKPEEVGTPRPQQTAPAATLQTPVPTPSAPR